MCNQQTSNILQSKLLYLALLKLKEHLSKCWSLLLWHVVTGGGVVLHSFFFGHSDSGTLLQNLHIKCSLLKQAQDGKSRPSLRAFLLTTLWESHGITFNTSGCSENQNKKSRGIPQLQGRPQVSNLAPDSTIAFSCRRPLEIPNFWCCKDMNRTGYVYYWTLFIICVYI